MVWLAYMCVLQGFSSFFLSSNNSVLLYIRIKSNKICVEIFFKESKPITKDQTDVQRSESTSENASLLQSFLI